MPAGHLPISTASRHRSASGDHASLRAAAASATLSARDWRRDGGNQQKDPDNPCNHHLRDGFFPTSTPATSHDHQCAVRTPCQRRVHVEQRCGNGSRCADRVVPRPAMRSASTRSNPAGNIPVRRRQRGYGTASSSRWRCTDRKGMDCHLMSDSILSTTHTAAARPRPERTDLEQDRQHGFQSTNTPAVRRGRSCGRPAI